MNRIGSRTIMLGVVILATIGIGSSAYSEMDFIVKEVDVFGRVAIPGWNITLSGKDCDGNEVNILKETDAVGEVRFERIKCGGYTISEELREGRKSLTYSVRSIGVGYANRYREATIYFPSVPNGIDLMPVSVLTIRDTDGDGRLGNTEKTAYGMIRVDLSFWTQVGEISIEVPMVPSGVGNISLPNGSYTFTGKIAENWVRAGWVSTTPTTVDINVDTSLSLAPIEIPFGIMESVPTKTPIPTPTMVHITPTSMPTLTPEHPPPTLLPPSADRGGEDINYSMTPTIPMTPAQTIPTTVPAYTVRESPKEAGTPLTVLLVLVFLVLFLFRRKMGQR